MHSTSDEYNSLIEEITYAFDGVSREDGISWREAEEPDNHSDPQEIKRARLLDNESSWQQVDPSLFEVCPSAIYFLNAKGFRYYLPALMIWSLRRGNQSKSATPDNFLSLLETTERQRWCFELLTAQQNETIRSFVRFMVRDYWNSSERANARLCYWLS